MQHFRKISFGVLALAAFALAAGGQSTVDIPAGCFDMGSPDGKHYGDDEKPRHRVCVDGFRMAGHEVTQEAYAKAMGNNPSTVTNCPTCPVETVTWHEAQDYCRKQGGRLPTEAEWEYAARAGTTTAYHWGNAMDDRYAWYNENSEDKSHPVGRKLPNAWGLYDMIGNVWEWTGDWYEANYYHNSPEQNPPGPSHGESRVLRGASWELEPEYLRTAVRFASEPGSGGIDVGFRCVLPR